MTRDSSTTLRTVFLVLPMLCCAAFGQDSETSQWLGAVRTTSGKQVEIHYQKGDKLRGTLVRGSVAELVLRRPTGETMIARGDVRQLRMRAGRSRGGRARLGAIIGGAIMCGLFIAAAASGGVDAPPGVVAAAGAVSAGMGAGIGAAIGAVIPDDYETIYSVPPPP